MKRFREKITWEKYPRGEFPFDWDRVTDESMAKCMTVDGVDEHTISNDAMYEIYDVLDLNELYDVEELRAVRNAVVHWLSNKTKKECADENGQWLPYKEVGKRMMELNMWMSAITAAIDHKMYTLDPRSV